MEWNTGERNCIMWFFYKYLQNEQRWKSACLNLTKKKVIVFQMKWLEGDILAIMESKTLLGKCDFKRIKKYWTGKTKHKDPLSPVVAPNVWIKFFVGRTTDGFSTMKKYSSSCIIAQHSSATLYFSSFQSIFTLLPYRNLLNEKRST